MRLQISTKILTRGASNETLPRWCRQSKASQLRRCVFYIMFSYLLEMVIFGMIPDC